jgi:hypothetical protein
MYVYSMYLQDTYHMHPIGRCLYVNCQNLFLSHNVNVFIHIIYIGLTYSSKTTTFYHNYLAMKNTADVTDGIMSLQTTLGVNADNPLVTSHRREKAILWFCSRLLYTTQSHNIVCIFIHLTIIRNGKQMFTLHKINVNVRFRISISSQVVSP